MTEWTGDGLPPYSPLEAGNSFKPEVAKTIEAKLDELDGELRELSLQIHGIVNDLVRNAEIIQVRLQTTLRLGSKRR